MRSDQMVIGVFLALGAVAGLFSNYVPVYSLKFLIPLFMYFAANILIAKSLKSKKFKLIIASSLATFLPVWLIVWIFLFNLR